MKDEDYILDICDRILDCKSQRQKRFHFLRGDPGKRHKGRMLPVDAYYDQHQLVVEYHERQHSESVLFFDKPNLITVSGVCRGEQRRLYDERRQVLLPLHMIRILVLDFRQFVRDRRGKLLRQIQLDEPVIRKTLRENGIEVAL